MNNEVWGYAEILPKMVLGDYFTNLVIFCENHSNAITD